MEETKLTKELTISLDNPDSKEICKFLISAYGYAIGDEMWWEWKHKKNPSGKSKVFTAKHKGNLVGLRPFQAANLGYKGKVIKAPYGADTAVDKSMRRQGLFTKLSNFALKNFKGSLSFATPNDKSCPGYQKCGWENVGGFDFFEKRLSSNLMVRLKFHIIYRNQKETPVNIDYLTKSNTISCQIPDNGEKLLRVYDQSLSNYIHLAPSLDWLRWRIKKPNYCYYFFCPSQNKDFLLLFSVVKYKGLKYFRIIDIFADYDSENVIRRGIDDFIKFAKKQADILQICCTSGHPIRKILPKKGFGKKYSINFVVNPNKNSLLKDDFAKNPDSWALTLSVVDFT